MAIVRQIKKRCRLYPALALCFLVLRAAAADEMPQRIRVGYCGAMRDMDAAQAAGFDYLETRVSEIAALTDAEFEKFVEKLKAIKMPVATANAFVPGNIKLTGPKTDKEQQMIYVRKALDRVSKLGVQLVVLGSGEARRVPDGFSNEEAFQQLVDFCRRIAPEARARNITIVIEPLCHRECNIINSTAEGLQLVEAVNDPNIQLLVDFYHFSVEKEDPAIIAKARAHIRHIHMANPNGRVFPLKPEEYNYAPFFESLRNIGYDRRISVEARTANFSEDAPQAVAFLRKAFTR